MNATDMGNVAMTAALSDRRGGADRLASARVVAALHLRQACCEAGDEVVYAGALEAYPIAVAITGATA